MSETARRRAAGLFGRPGFLARRLYQIYAALYQEECEAFATTPVQSSVLQVLLLRPGLDQISLGTEIGVDRTTVSDVLARLEKRGLVRREADAEDRRLRRVFVTPDGEVMVVAMQDALERAHARLLEPLAAGERAAFVKQMKRLTDRDDCDTTERRI